MRAKYIFWFQQTKKVHIFGHKKKTLKKSSDNELLQTKANSINISSQFVPFCKIAKTQKKDSKEETITRLIKFSSCKNEISGFNVRSAKTLPQVWH